MAKQQGATAAEAVVSAEDGFNVNVRMGEIETVEHHRDKEVAITVYVGQCSGMASTADFSDEALQMTVAKAINIAKYTHEDPFAGLADAELMAHHFPDLNLYHPWSITPEKATELAIECEALGRAFDKRITNSDGVSISSHETLHAYGNTNDFIGYYPSTQHQISCVLIANDGHEMQRSYDYSITTDAHDLEHIEYLAKNAAKRTVSRLGAKRLTTRRCPVIFHAEIARGLLGNFVSAISGGNLYRNSSFLVNKLHQPVFADFIHIQERPHIPKAIASAPFDEEGVLTRTKDVVRDGVLQTYILDSYSARKLKMQTTGNAGGVHNLIIANQGIDLDGLLKQMGTGLLVTELMGQGANIVTGDYSRGAFGYWVENGVIQGPVQEITIAGNLADMYRNIVAVANDIDHRGSVHTGSILIAEMMIAGQ
ncbi:MAG: metalloprotease PmbA [Coxiellaceae bacterium]|nr:MAG: metalloprotease PmbA [Coxiellaceae bacterium]